MPNEYDNSPQRRRRTLQYYAFSLSLLLLLMLVISALRSRPVEETITVDSTRPANAEAIQPIVTTRQLPPSDADVEIAGDRVAEAMVHLEQRQNELALNALAQAQAATERALKSKPRENGAREALLATNQQIERVKQVIRKGRVENATRELREVNQQLESLSY